MEKKKILGYYNYTVVLTYIGMLTGFWGILYVFEENIGKAVLCLMVAGLCDMFDGTIASTRKRNKAEKCFGIQIDSLSDLICFGTLPAIIVFADNKGNALAVLICAMYVLCALIRLAYFNVDEQERQKKSSSERTLYMGMPVTVSALLLPAVYGGLCIFQIRSSTYLILLLLLMAVLFLAPVPLRKPKLLGKICMLLCGVMEALLVLFACMDV